MVCVGAGVVPDGVCYAAMMESYRRQGQGHKAVQLYQQLQVPPLPNTAVNRTWRNAGRISTTA